MNREVIIIIIGNVFSAIGMMLLAISVHQKNRRRMLDFQILDTLFTAVACGVLGGYSGLTTDLLAMTRNIINAHNEGKNVTKLKINIECAIIVIALAVTGLLANNKGFIGLFPIIACIEYTVVMFVTKNSNVLRISLAINTFMWCIYNLIIQDYVGFTVKIFLVLNTLIAVIRDRKEISHA